MGSPNRLRPYWKCKQDRKKARRSQTKGSTKQGCVKNQQIVNICARGRSYKYPYYFMLFQKNSGGKL